MSSTDWGLNFSILFGAATAHISSHIT